MPFPFFLIAVLPFAIWLLILLLPWQPWRTRESWDCQSHSMEEDLNEVTVLIPARNEATVIAETLPRVLAQGRGLRMVLIDDRSKDDTGGLARQLGGEAVTVLSGQPLPKSWSGKLWALQQGLDAVQTPFTVLLDADIALEKGVIAGLKRKMERESLDFVSLMAMPPLLSFWEKLLMPAFVYFFKLLYPFGLSNSRSRWVAAGAGGCILVRTEALRRIDAFGCIREALIDDCSLARQIKNAGCRTWIGLTHSARSIRPYERLADIWNMVARTAYTQLRYNPLLLMLCTLALIVTFILPVVLLFHPALMIRGLAAGALLLMYITYLPQLRYYDLSLLWALTLPLTGTLYLAMTWTSAIRYWRGERMRWRGRVVYEGLKFTRPEHSEGGD
jgi:hopene-associated glycosyltransferase HpnB